MTKRRLLLYLNMASNTIQTKVNTEGIYKDTARQLLIADMLTFGKYPFLYSCTRSQVAITNRYFPQLQLPAR